MSIELQIQSSVLRVIIARAVQARLRTTCFPPIASLYVDHADVATTPIELFKADAAIRLRVPLDLFIVRREDVLAAPNAVPAGATASVGTVVIVLELAATGAVVSLRCVDAVPDPKIALALGANAATAKAVIVNAVGSLPPLNLTEALRGLGMASPSSSKVELVGGVVAIRFEPAGDAAARLFSGHEWGMFLDGVSGKQLVRSKVLDELKLRIPSLTTVEHWRPAADTPHVDVDYAAAFKLEPHSANVDGTLGCDFSLTPTITKFLRTTVHWSFHSHLHLNLGSAVPGFVENTVESFIEDYVESKIGNAFDPATLGGTAIGDRAFNIDSSLPDVSFAGARLGYASLLASPAGMTLGGAVRLPPDPGKDTVKPSVTKFGFPYRLTSCRVLAKSGSGEPSKTVLPGEVYTNGSITLSNLGAFCDFEILSQANLIMPFVRPPTDTATIWIVIPSLVALGITEPVRLVVRTARGVRLVDLGTPPPVDINEQGNVTNAHTSHIKDCFFLDVEHGIKWALAGGLSDQSVVNPPMEDPDWATYRGRHLGLEVQLVTLFALEPGELIQFRSADHAIDVTADRNGRSVVPILLPVSNDQIQASLIRVNRRSIVGHFTTQTAIFMEQANLPAGTLSRWDSTVNGMGASVLTTEFEEHIDSHEIGPLGAPMLLKREKVGGYESGGRAAQANVSRCGASMEMKEIVQRESESAISSQTRQSHEEVALNPQPLPPRKVVTAAYNPFLAQRIDLPGITSLIAVPGFAEAPIALAKLADGSMLVLDLGEDGTARVAGTFNGPIGVLDVSGDWAFAEDRDRVSIFRVTRD